MGQYGAPKMKFSILFSRELIIHKYELIIRKNKLVYRKNELIVGQSYLVIKINNYKVIRAPDNYFF